MDDLEVAWAAGFFDGEGWTGLDRRPAGAYLRVAISQKDRRPLVRFAQALGLGSVPTKPAKNGMYHWRAAGPTARAALELLLPRLSEPKREQAEAALAAASPAERKHTRIQRYLG